MLLQDAPICQRLSLQTKLFQLAHLRLRIVRRFRMLRFLILSLGVELILLINIPLHCAIREV